MARNPPAEAATLNSPVALDLSSFKVEIADQRNAREALQEHLALEEHTEPPFLLAPVVLQFALSSERTVVVDLYWGVSEHEVDELVDAVGSGGSKGASSAKSDVRGSLDEDAASDGWLRGILRAWGTGSGAGRRQGDEETGLIPLEEMHTGGGAMDEAREYSRGDASRWDGDGEYFDTSGVLCLRAWNTRTPRATFSPGNTLKYVSPDGEPVSVTRELLQRLLANCGEASEDDASGLRETAERNDMKEGADSVGTMSEGAVEAVDADDDDRGSADGHRGESQEAEGDGNRKNSYYDVVVVIGTARERGFESGDDVYHHVVALRADGVSLTVEKHYLLRDGTMFELQCVFGRDESDTPDCVVCLCEPKSTVLLPCRHFVVCNSCYYRLDRCPICRSEITSYMQFYEEENEVEDVDRDDEKLDDAAPHDRVSADELARGGAVEVVVE